MAPLGWNHGEEEQGGGKGTLSLPASVSPFRGDTQPKLLMCCDQPLGGGVWGPGLLSGSIRIS